MISFEDALSIVLEHVKPLPMLRKMLSRAAGYVLAEPVTVTSSIPAFDNSAMDGFGVRAADVTDPPVRLRLIGTVRAGDAGAVVLLPGTAVRILTGAPIPKGVDAVVMKEYCEIEGDDVLLTRSARPGENIRRAGEEFRPGDTALPAGLRVSPPVIGLLATLGQRSCRVHRRPGVALLVTGDELEQPGTPLLPGHIYDANTPALTAALAEAGVHRPFLLHTVDEPTVLREQMRRALATSDVVLTAGGVSVGDYDFVKDVCAELGVSMKFWQVAMKPAKPVYFGVLDDEKRRRYVFGLPGNPVSALVSFHLLVRPALNKLMGLRQVAPLLLTATLTSRLRKKAGRVEFVRGVASSRDGRLQVEPTTGQDSHMLGGLSLANCLIHFPTELETLEEGMEITIEMLNW
ncbi:MAG: molybdopterin molybdotransferase MoeA [Armatimonadota bacterium]